MPHRLKKKSEDWRRRLPRPIVLRDGRQFRLLADCRDYCVNDLDDFEASTPAWQRAAALLLAAAEGGDLEAVVQQFETLLLHRGKLVVPD